MKIEVGSKWVNKNDLDNTVTVDIVGAFAVSGHNDEDELYMASRVDFLHYFELLPEPNCISLSELSEQEFKNIIDEAFEEGYAQAYSELETKTERKHSHYFKDVRHLDYIDIYQVCKLFEVEDTSHCTHHSIKKLLMSGKRGAKDKLKDIIEARDTLNRYLQIEGIE